MRPRVKIDPIQYLLAVFGEHRIRVAIELKGQAAIVLNAGGDPETRLQLIPKASANGIALILRIREMAGDLGRRSCGVAPRNRPPVTGNQAFPTM